MLVWCRKGPPGGALRSLMTGHHDVRVILTVPLGRSTLRPGKSCWRRRAACPISLAKLCPARRSPPPPGPGRPGLSIGWMGPFVSQAMPPRPPVPMRRRLACSWALARCSRPTPRSLTLPWRTGRVGSWALTGRLVELGRAKGRNTQLATTWWPEDAVWPLGHCGPGS